MSKKISLAVVGAPSSGKTYLIADLIMAFRVMGFKADDLSINSPHRSFGGFFYDASPQGQTGFRQTPNYSCGPDDHYGGIMRHGCSDVEVDFLNIPGEIFLAITANIKHFDTLYQAIESIKRNAFWIQSKKTPLGQTQRLVSFGPDDDKRQGSARNGKYLLEHFFELEPSSIRKTILDNWSQLFPGMQKEEYDTIVKNHFYFYLYCKHATDVVVCDKMFLPGNKKDKTSSAEYANTLSILTNMLNGLKKAPHVYLAFRGADFLLEQLEVVQEGSIVHRSNIAYERFLQTLRCTCFGEDKATDEDDLPLHNPQQCTLSGTTLRDHVTSRCSHDYWQLMSYSNAKMGKLEHKTNRPFLPPHVYFTATPIDSEGRVYRNDSKDVHRFVHSPTQTSFHMNLNSQGGESLCFGSLQLLADILNTHNALPNRNEYKAFSYSFGEQL